MGQSSQQNVSFSRVQTCNDGLKAGRLRGLLRYGIKGVDGVHIDEILNAADAYYATFLRLLANGVKYALRMHSARTAERSAHPLGGNIYALLNVARDAYSREGERTAR